MSRLFVGNLAHHVNDGELRGLFVEYGNVLSAVIKWDPDAERGRGYGWVQFANAQDAQAAVIALNGRKFHDRVLRVELARGQNDGNTSRQQSAGPASGFTASDRLAQPPGAATSQFQYTGQRNLGQQPPPAGADMPQVWDSAPQGTTGGESTTAWQQPGYAGGQRGAQSPWNAPLPATDQAPAALEEVEEEEEDLHRGQRNDAERQWGVQRRGRR